MVPWHRPRGPSELLQLNLCASGQAGCYTGRSIDVAAQVIRDTRPDVVTLNEICEGDIDTLGSVLAGVHGELVTSGFRAAPDRPSGGPTRCGRNGQAYGIGLIARMPTTPYEVVGGVYPVQDPVDPEERVWLCLLAAVDVCTTHLAGFDSEAALHQCQHLFGVTLPALHRRAGYHPDDRGRRPQPALWRAAGPAGVHPAGLPVARRRRPAARVGHRPTSRSRPCARSTWPAAPTTRACWSPSG